jgi:hypothetical protein
MEPLKTIVRFFPLVALLLAQCSEPITSPDSGIAENVRNSLDSVDVVLLEFFCAYNGFPIYPPVPRFAVIGGKMRLHNSASVAIADSLTLDHGVLFRNATAEPLSNFTFSDLIW